MTLALVVCFMPWAVRNVVWRKREEPLCQPLQRNGRAEPEGRLVFVNAAPCTPTGVVSFNNAREACSFDSGVCYGSYLCLHKPTSDPEKMASGDYPYGEHMHGRKRLWEFRLQLTFRQDVDGEFYFGAEQDRYYHIAPPQRLVSHAVNMVLKRVATGMYQTHGEDPASSSGEKERPALVFPLWVLDQIIITPAGDTPPDLTDSQFSTFGRIKADNRAAMQKELGALRFERDLTYTFGFWCIAQFIDAIAWSSRSPPGGVPPAVPMADLGTHPPCYITMYALKPKDEWENRRGAADNRHLDSRKIYLWRVALWSSKVPPDPRRARELTTVLTPVQEQEPAGKRPPLPQRRVRCCSLWDL